MLETWREALDDVHYTKHAIQSVREQVYVLLHGKLGITTDDAE